MTAALNSPQARPAPAAPPGPTPPAAPRPAPLWLRLAVLLGFALLLASPVVWLAARGLFSGEQGAAQAAAEEFLAVIGTDDLVAVRDLLVPEAADLDVPDLFPSSHLLAWQFLTWEATGNNTSAEEASVRFRLHLRPDRDASRGLGVRVNVPPPDLMGGILTANRDTFQREYEALIKDTEEKARSLDGRDMEVHLRRVAGRWRVSGWRLLGTQVGGPALSRDYARLASDRAAAKLAADLEARSADQLAPLDRGQVEGAWRTDLDVRGQAAGDVLRKLAADLGMRLLAPNPRGEALAEALKRPVTLRLQGVSRLQAVEEVCRAAGLVPSYAAGSLSLSPGSRARAVAFAGPFLVEAGDLAEYTPNPTGLLTVKVRAAGLPEAVAGLMRGTGSSAAAPRVTDAAGRDLYHPSEQPYFPPAQAGVGMLADGRHFEETFRYPLRNLLADLDEVAAVRGRLRLPVPGAVDEARLDLTPGARAQAGETVLELRGVKPVSTPAREAPPDADRPFAPALLPPPASAAPAGGKAFLLELEARGVDGGRLLWWLARDRQGRVTGRGHERLAADGPLTLRVGETAAALTVKLLREPEFVEYEFLLEHLPLRPRTPRALAPPLFPGHDAPVTVTVPGLVAPPGGGLVVRVTNHSQKDVQRLVMTWAYLDASGATLSEVVVTHPPEKSPVVGDRLPVVAPAGKSQDVNVRTAAPPEARSVQVRVLGVGFSDGTDWAP